MTKIATPDDLLTPSVLILNGQSVSAGINLGRRDVIRLYVSSGWNTAADLTVDLSADGTTWRTLMDSAGSVITYKIAAGRVVVVPVGDLLKITHIRLRSGTPTTPVPQTGTAVVMLETGTL